MLKPRTNNYKHITSTCFKLFVLFLYTNILIIMINECLIYINMFVENLSTLWIKSLSESVIFHISRMFEIQMYSILYFYEHEIYITDLTIINSPPFSIPTYHIIPILRYILCFRFKYKPHIDIICCFFFDLTINFQPLSSHINISRYVVLIMIINYII